MNAKDENEHKVFKDIRTADQGFTTQSARLANITGTHTAFSKFGH